MSWLSPSSQTGAPPSGIDPPDSAGQPQKVCGRSQRPFSGWSKLALASRQGAGLACCHNLSHEYRRANTAELGVRAGTRFETTDKTHEIWSGAAPSASGRRVLNRFASFSCHRCAKPGAIGEPCMSVTQFLLHLLAIVASPCISRSPASFVVQR